MRSGPKKLRVIHVEHSPCDRWRALLCRLDQSRQLGDVVRSEHDVDEWRLAKQSIALLLGHTSRNGHDGSTPALFEGPKSSKEAHQLVLGLLPDTTGIDDQEIGQRWLRRLAIAARA